MTIETEIAEICDEIALLREGIVQHHKAIWAEWSPSSRGCPPPADVALWALVGLDPIALFKSEQKERG